MERMSPFRQRHQSIQGLQAPAVDTPFVVDPFDPDLHKSLLAGLDPPLEQVVPLYKLLLVALFIYFTPADI